MLRSLRVRGGDLLAASRPYCTGGGGGGGATTATAERRLRYGREFGGHLLRDDRSVMLVRYRAGEDGARRKAEAVAERLGITAVAVHTPPREQRGAEGGRQGMAGMQEMEEEEMEEQGGRGGGREDKLKLRLSREEAEELEESLPRTFLKAVDGEGPACKHGVFSLDVTEQELCLRFVRAKGMGTFLRSSKWMVDFGRQHRRDHGFNAAKRRRGTSDAASRTSRPPPLLRALGAKGTERGSDSESYALPWHMETPVALPWPTGVTVGGGEERKSGGDGSLLVPSADGESQEVMRVLDVCAGMGNDAFLIAKAGGQVLMVERHPVVHLLLRDGVERARALAEAAMTGQGGTPATEHIDGEFVAAVRRLGIVEQPTDALPLLQALGTGDDCGLPRPHVVFVDPMHSTRSSKGRTVHQAQLPTFKMQMARAIVGSSSRDEQHKLLDLALGAATQRVIYKRPQYAEALPSNIPTPLAEYKAKAVSYTVFPGTK